MLAAGAGRPRVLVEVLTAMRRHGLSEADLVAAGPLLGDVAFEGWTIHLPLREDGRYAEAVRLARAALAVAPGTLWLSHLPSRRGPSSRRASWAGRTDPSPSGPGSARACGWATPAGGRPPPPSSTSTGSAGASAPATAVGSCPGPAGSWSSPAERLTASGLEAPTSASSLRQRATALATGSLGAAGRALSPFTIDGRKRWFLEPPHMQSSLVFLPASATPPAVGDEVPVELRLTIATPDAVILCVS